MKIHDEERKIEVLQYRVGLFTGAIIYPLFGLLSQILLKINYDSFWIRKNMFIYCSIFLILSFKSKFILKYMRYFILIGCFICFDDYLVYFVKSNYHFYYSIGLTAIPFIAVSSLFYPVDVLIYFIFIFIDGYWKIPEINFIFVSVYTLLMLVAFSFYLLIFGVRMRLLNILKISLEETAAKNQSLTRIGELAAQVAHDIRSPVGALKVVSQTLEDLDPQKKKLIENAATRINNIADYLVAEYRTSLTSDLANRVIQRAESINEVIQEIVNEKNATSKNEFVIDMNVSEKVDVPDALNLIEFKRILSNILNNSIEAFDKPNSKIIISLKKVGGLIKIQIEDNGKGIPHEYISKLFEKGASFGKKSGTGLGLSHARTYLESIGGKIILSSHVKIGTVINIEMKAEV